MPRRAVAAQRAIHEPQPARPADAHPHAAGVERDAIELDVLRALDFQRAGFRPAHYDVLNPKMRRLLQREGVVRARDHEWQFARIGLAGVGELAEPRELRVRQADVNATGFRVAARARPAINAAG